MTRLDPQRAVRIAFASLAALVAFFALQTNAQAIPAFARKYQTSCLTCHTIYPVLNPFGEAFRRNGYRFPSQNGSVDSDAVKATMIALGQEEYKKTFPNSVWPSNIPDAIPLSIMFNGQLTMNIPGEDAHAAAGNTFTWDGLVAEFHMFAGGALSDTLTYMAQLTISQQGDNSTNGDIETAYLLWNDILGPAHAVNIWLGRLWNPQITSFGLNSTFLSDTRMPGVSVIGLYNGSGGFSLGAETAHNDGIELNGIIKHRYAYSIGWLASHTASGLNDLNAEDAYVHIGVKSGGVALDGEGKYGPSVPDPAKPWAEKAITVDAFGYHGLNVLDNGTGTVQGGAATPIAQQDKFDAVGGTIRAQYDSAVLDVGGQYEWHSHPYAGTSAIAAPGGSIIPGAPNYTSAAGVVAWGELDYIIWPWLVPGVRAEYTLGNSENAPSFSLLRVIPGVAMLVRPDVRVILTGDMETAKGAPVAGSWGATGGSIAAAAPGTTAAQLQSAFKAETVSASVAVAF